MPSGPPVSTGVEQVSRLQVHQLTGEVGVGDLQVVGSLAVADPVVDRGGLGVDEVGREVTGVAAEEGVGQRHVTPEDPGDVQPHEQHGESVQHAPSGVGLHALAEDGPVGQ